MIRPDTLSYRHHADEQNNDVNEDHRNHGMHAYQKNNDEGKKYEIKRFDTLYM